MEIIYEDKNIVVVNKPAGLLVHHTDKSGEGKTFTDWLLEHYPEVATVGDAPSKRPGIVHRLDKDTSGVIVAAKNQETFERVKKEFQKRLVDKTYWAIVFGNPKNNGDVIEGTISLKEGTTKRTIHKGKMPKEAVTEYRVLERFDNSSLLEIHPKTGRTHQIRVHLASINHPVLGDQLYSSKTSRKFSIPGLHRQMLHAYSIELEAEKGKRTTLIAAPPEDFEEVLKYMRKPSTLHTQ